MSEWWLGAVAVAEMHLCGTAQRNWERHAGRREGGGGAVGGWLLCYNATVCLTNSPLLRL